MNRYFLEEKKNGLMPRVAPELSMETFWYYKNAHYIDQKWSVRACGVRQRHIDQAQSMNLYITNEYTFRKSVGSLYSCVGRRCENDLLYTFKKFGSGGM